MAKQSEETKLKRRKPENRRGVFTTWGADTWQALLATADRDVTDVLSECPAVGAVERDITQSVLERKWRPPPGQWLLVVNMDVQDWATLVVNSWAGEVLETLAPEFDGRMLLAGHSDAAGTVYARILRPDPDADAGVAIEFDFQSDGTPWDDEEEEDGEEDEDEEDEELDEMEQALLKLTETRLVADDLPPDWLEQFDSLPDAHQAVFRHLDAYIPGLYYATPEYQLCAPFGHDDILPHVTRIDLVRLGKVPKEEPTPELLAATRELHEAISASDVDAVKKSIAAGAILAPTDGGNSALYIACCDVVYEPHEPRVEIVHLLLDAGADPNENRPHDETNDHCDTPLARLIGRRPPLKFSEPIARRLVDAGADLNAPSPYPLQLGERPLHHAAKKALPEWVTLLLELGADPLATSDSGRTVRQSVEDLIEGKEASDFYSAADMIQERKDYAPILAMLENAEKEHQ